jgi:Fe-S-cluster-containing hydrogenase component 2
MTPRGRQAHSLAGKGAEMRIAVQEEKCTGCKLCQQICAINHFSEINPKKSSIYIKAAFPDPGVFTPHVCTQCGECEDNCLMGAISRKGDGYEIDPDVCTFCLSCVDMCTAKVLRVHDDEETPIICDLCLKCVEVCHSGALTAVQ